METEFQVNPMTGSIKAPASGKVDLTITKIVFDDNPVDITCEPTAEVVAGTFTVGAAFKGEQTTQQGVATTADTGALPKTEPEDWWKSALVALLLFQIGAIVWVRTKRHPDATSRHAAI